MDSSNFAAEDDRGTALVEIIDLTRSFSRRGVPFDAVSHVNLTIKPGEFVAIVGRSGNGKSTLINMIAGLVRPSSGSVRIDGRDISALRDRELSLLRNSTIGFVTQSQTLLANLTVMDNVTLPAMLFGVSTEEQGRSHKIGQQPSAVAPYDSSTRQVAAGGTTASGTIDDPYMPDVIAPIRVEKQTADTVQKKQNNPIEDRARTLLERLGVGELAESHPRELSGGEMKRVSIARSLMNNPKLVIADEPTGDLDQASTDIVMRLLREQANNGTAVLVVTHDPDVLTWADKVYRMDAGALSMASV
ncbi:ABC transporter ATP-binding protein [Bifidobacterium scaligerum]|uniref:ABC transporter ATP-binding protein n=1 Tax=Bifidobacterium scaligerum TaxID=2052656 RepID=A0A2M9HTM0_9BIFI|nr:ABC transporter ATP-binding protein [Bifidobacterium scaligerum]PJM80174.1 ABC transporter ATP-binding protein [Bifidobacterium scaligerum]